MARLSLSSLRARLLLLVPLAVRPDFGLMLVTAWEHRQQDTDGMRRHAQQLAEIISAEHERLIEGARQLLTALARLPEVCRQDARAGRTLFTDLLRQYRIYRNLGVAGTDGHVFCSALALDRPGPRVVFVTGDTLSPAFPGFLEHPAAPTLKDPFNPRDVRTMVGRVVAWHPD